MTEQGKENRAMPALMAWEAGIGRSTPPGHASVHGLEAAKRLLAWAHVFGGGSGDDLARRREGVRLDFRHFEESRRVNEEGSERRRRGANGIG